MTSEYKKTDSSTYIQYKLLNDCMSENHDQGVEENIQ